MSKENIPAKKILAILQLPPPLHGASMMNSFVAKSDLINSNFNMDIINLQFSKSVHELKKMSLAKIFKSIKYFLRIFSKMKKFKPDIVYYNFTPNGFALYRDALYILTIKLFKPEVILHIHSKGIKKNSEESYLKRKIYTTVFKNTNPICLSKFLAQELDGVFDSAPYIVPNGIPPVTFQVNKTRNCGSSIIHILFLSNYIESKGIFILLDALQMLKKKGYNFECRLVGSPADITIPILAENINKRGLDSNVKIVGPKYNEEKGKEFENADIFVLPTFYFHEAFPLVILEALQFGIPVISTFEGGIPEMIIDNETGFLVESKNVQMLFKKIASLIDDENLRIQIGKNGYKSFQDQFTLKHFELNMLKVFNT